MAFAHLQVEMGNPVIQAGFADMRLGAQHGRQVCHVEERMGQAITQAVLERSAKHVLVEWCVERQQRAVADKVHEVQ